jgi:hypothetical protein
MKKNLVIAIFCILSLIQIPSVQAETENTSYEMLLEDVVYTFLAPLRTKAIEDYFGDIYMSRFCKFIEVKRKPDMGYAYEITYQFITYERSFMPPYHLFTLKAENEALTEWVIKDVSVEKLDGKIEGLKCRKPTQVQ